MTQSKTSSARGSEVTLESQRGVMAIEVPQNEEIYGGGKNGGRKGIVSSIRWEGANMGGGVYPLRNYTEEELFREMLTPT